MNGVRVKFEKPRRFRDPVFDLYTFNDDTDRIALDLIDTAAFQRLRRIKQLGFADHVYPGASHTRFAHSLGVYAGARMLIRSVREKNPESKDLFDGPEMEVAALAALLHDIGHGPLSHAFEKVHEVAFGNRKSHEKWTEEIITKNQDVAGILGSRGASVASLLAGRRLSCWSAIVSSALDADRLDYVRRDRLMSGTGTGAIDFTWLLEHARLRSGPIPGVAGREEVDVRTFAVNRSALQQAEVFLLARYQLYDQVYFHKVCRGFESMLTACLAQLGSIVKDKKWADVGLAEGDALVQYFNNPILENYLRMDDTTLFSGIEKISRSEAVSSGNVVELAKRIFHRRKADSVNLERIAAGHDYALLRDRAIAFVKAELKLVEGREFFFDEPQLSIYGKADRESVDLHKKLWVDCDPQTMVEITHLSSVVSGQPAARRIGRLFFLRPEDCKATEEFVAQLAVESARRRQRQDPAQA